MTATGGRSTGSNRFFYMYDNGTVHYNFTKLEKVVDWLKNAGITPVFVIGNTPIDLSPDKNNIDYGAFDANTAEPSDYMLYYYYIRNLTAFILNYGGEDFVAKWTWRIYTEPDNEDWLKGGLDVYFKIYNYSCAAIRSVLPNAVLELGNMMEKEFTSEYRKLIDRLNSEIPHLFPNIIGWSVYGTDYDDLFLDKSFSGIHDWMEYLRSIGRYDIEFVIEEGQLLFDDKGRRLWGGDSTELGAAFTANVYKRCIINGITRYTAWGFYTGGSLRTPKLNVVDMFRKMRGYTAVSFTTKYEPFLEERRKTIDGLGAVTSNGTSAYVLIYNLVADRDNYYNISLNIQLKSVPGNISRLNIYMVDGFHSNFHRDWDKYSADFKYVTHEGYNDGSPYDVWLEMVLEQEYREKLYKWAWEHKDSYTLERISTRIIGKTDSGEFGAETFNFGIGLEIGVNTVILLEFF